MKIFSTAAANIDSYNLQRTGSEQLEECLQMLESCLSSFSSLEFVPKYAQVLLRLSETFRTNAIRRWLRDQGGHCFVETSAGVLSCILEDTPEMKSALESHPGISEIQTVQTVALQGSTLKLSGVYTPHASVS